MSSTLSATNLFESFDVSDLSSAIQRLGDGTLTGNERDNNGQTYLMAACAQGDLEVTKQLLENDVPVNAVDDDDWSALHYATKDGHRRCVVALLDNGADLEQRDVGGWTPLMWACYKGRLEIVHDLLSRGANVHVKGEHHMSCIIWAAGRGYVEITKLLLDNGAKVNTTDKYGTSPLVWAARKGHLEIVQLLLAANANVDIAGMYSWTPLIVAAKHGFVEVVRALLEHNPNINSIDKDGFTALTNAVKCGHAEIVDVLLENGAYVNLCDKDGDSILIHAVKSGNLEIIETLLHKYADVDVQGFENKTALYHAVEKGYINVVRALLSFNPDLEFDNKAGETPLMRAIRMRHTDIVDLLLHKGAKVSAADKKGDTALHLALKGRSRKVTELLLRNPKNSRLLYRQNKNGETPYMIDSNHQKSILTQIFGARNLNAKEANENLLGYELYSSTIADVLSEPTLCTPITVGLYAKWGSGKSFLLDKLKTEMQLFENHSVDKTLKFSWLIFFFCSLIGVITGITFGLTLGWPVGLGTGVGVLAILFTFFGLVLFGTHVKDWELSYKISVYLASKFGQLKLLLQVIFCNPGDISKDTSLVRYLFTGYTKLTSFSGEQSIAMMVATLADEVEKEVGVVAARLFRVFKSNKGGTRRKYRSICCVPNFVFVIFVLMCLIAGVILLVIFPIKDINTSNISVLGSLIALAMIVGFALIGNVYTWWRMVAALLKPQRKCVMQAMAHMKSNKVEKFIHTLKDEVAVLTNVINSMNGFTGHQYRLVVFVDGLDSSEQEKLLQVLDMVNILFSEMDSPFMTILAVDPHIIIKGIEQNLPSLFRDSNINGHDYLRNVVHFPVFLQNQGSPPEKLLRQHSQRTISESNTCANHLSRESPPKLSAQMKRLMNERQESVMSSTSLDKVVRSKKKRDSKFSMFGSTTNYVASTTDLSKTLMKNDYFSDINPRSMRRLMNIVALTARLLRAYSIDYSWHRLASWVNITEQWPYRTSWIIWYIEDKEDVDDSLSLKEIYDKVLPRIPVAREVEPLLEIDRNTRKFEAFLSNNSPILTIADVKKFMPCCINIDPFLRKRIREYMKSYESQSQMPDFSGTNAFSRGGGSDSSNSIDAGRFRRISGEQSHPAAYCSPNKMPAAVNPYMYSMMVPSTPVMRMPYVVPSHHTPGKPDAVNLTNMIGGTKKVYLKGGIPKHNLSTMNLDNVCELLLKLKGLGQTAIPKYHTAIIENNVNGFVLFSCDIDELKPVLGMNFGDWQLFKAMVLALRSHEEENLNGVPTVDPYGNHYVVLSADDFIQPVHAGSEEFQSSDTMSSVRKDLHGNHLLTSVADDKSAILEGIDKDDMVQQPSSTKSDNPAEVVSNEHGVRHKTPPLKLARHNSLAHQVQMESMILNDVIDEFSEGSDMSDGGSDNESPIYFKTHEGDSSQLTTPETNDAHDTGFISGCDTPMSSGSKLRKQERVNGGVSPCGSSSKVQFLIPGKTESVEMKHVPAFHDADMTHLPSEQATRIPDHFPTPVKGVLHLRSSCTTSDMEGDDMCSVRDKLLGEEGPKYSGIEVDQLDNLSDQSAEGNHEGSPLLNKKVLRRAKKSGKATEVQQTKNRTLDHMKKQNSDERLHQTLARSAAYSSGFELLNFTEKIATSPTADYQILRRGRGSQSSSLCSSRAPSNESIKTTEESIPGHIEENMLSESSVTSSPLSPTRSSSSSHGNRSKKSSMMDVAIEMPSSNDTESTSV